MEKIFRDEIEWLNEQLVQTNIDKDTLQKRIVVLERKNAEHERQQVSARAHDGESTSTSTMESNVRRIQSKSIWINLDTKIKTYITNIKEQPFSALRSYEKKNKV